MKQLFTIACAAIILCSCNRITGSGRIVTEKRNTGNFNGISVSQGIEVDLKSGETNVVAETDDNVMRFLETEVVNGTLRIRLSGHNSYNNVHFKVYVSAPEINRLTASSASEIDAIDVLRSGDDIKLSSSSAGHITAEINAPGVSAESSSGGGMKLTGRTRDFKATVSSGANLEAEDLLSENTIVNASSGGHAYVHASVSIKANASSGSNIRYKGGAPENAHASSGGSVSKED